MDTAIPPAPDQVNVNARMRDVMDVLYPSLNAAARAARMHPGTLHNLISDGNPGVRTLSRIAAAWGVPLWVFTAPEEIARPYVEETRLKNLLRNRQ